MDDQRRRRSRAAADAALPVEPAAVRDASAILARAAADEAAATEARARYRAGVMCTIEPDERISPLLGAETVIAVRHAASIDRREPSIGRGRTGLAGDLYLTSRRLVLVGHQVVEFELTDIQEAAMSGDRLLLVMQNGSGVALDVDRPRLLRAEIGAARADARPGVAAGGDQAPG